MVPLSVIICTFNPKPHHIQPTLKALEAQTLPKDQWELIVIDNGSTPPLQLDLPPNGRIVREERVGLYYANLCGFHEAQGTEIFITVDDDNVLEKHYLENALRQMRAHPSVGVSGGKVLPVYETTPPDWLEEAGTSYLACRYFGEKVRIHPWKETTNTGQIVQAPPVGAGMVMRREVAKAYISRKGVDEVAKLFDRRGGKLSTGNDIDVLMVGLSMGYDSAYFPDLSLDHLLPSGRLTLEYNLRVHRGVRRSWPVVFALHGVCAMKPIPRWTVPLRVARAWLRMKPWKSPLHRIRFMDTVGTFEGLADLGEVYPDHKFHGRNLNLR